MRAKKAPASSVSSNNGNYSDGALPDADELEDDATANHHRCEEFSYFSGPGSTERVTGYKLDAGLLLEVPVALEALRFTRRISLRLPLHPKTQLREALSPSEEGTSVSSDTLPVVLGGEKDDGSDAPSQAILTRKTLSFASPTSIRAIALYSREHPQQIAIDNADVHKFFSFNDVIYETISVEHSARADALGSEALARRLRAAGVRDSIEKHLILQVGQGGRGHRLHRDYYTRGGGQTGLAGSEDRMKLYLLLYSTEILELCCQRPATPGTRVPVLVGSLVLEPYHHYYNTLEKQINYYDITDRTRRNRYDNAFDGDAEGTIPMMRYKRSIDEESSHKLLPGLSQTLRVTSTVERTLSSLFEISVEAQNFVLEQWSLVPDGTREINAIGCRTLLGLPDDLTLLRALSPFFGLYPIAAEVARPLTASAQRHWEREQQKFFITNGYYYNESDMDGYRTVVRSNLAAMLTLLLLQLFAMGIIRIFSPSAMTLPGSAAKAGFPGTTLALLLVLMPGNAVAGGELLAHGGPPAEAAIAAAMVFVPASACLLIPLCFLSQAMYKAPLRVGAPPRWRIERCIPTLVAAPPAQAARWAVLTQPYRRKSPLWPLLPAVPALALFIGAISQPLQPRGCVLMYGVVAAFLLIMMIFVALIDPFVSSLFTALYVLLQLPLVLLLLSEMAITGMLPEAESTSLHGPAGEPHPLLPVLKAISVVLRLILTFITAARLAWVLTLPLPKFGLADIDIVNQLVVRQGLSPSWVRNALCMKPFKKHLLISFAKNDHANDTPLEAGLMQTKRRKEKSSKASKDIKIKNESI